MDEFLKWLASNPSIATTLILAIGILIFATVLMYLVAFLQGREISFWPPKIGAKREKEEENIARPNPPIKSGKSNKITYPRIALMCSTTYEIEKSPERIRSLGTFYQSLIAEIERTHYGINFCGAEPLRSHLFDYYCSKLRILSKSQMQEFNESVRWYWFMGDNVGTNVAPAFFDSHQTSDAIQRTIAEVSNADVIIAFTGRTGTRREIERVLQFHSQHKSGFDLDQKPLILLGWFGGSVKEFIDENRSRIEWILQKYTELKPIGEIPNWYEDGQPAELARTLMNTVRRLVEEKAKK